MSFENTSGLGVYSSYGKRSTGGSVGSETTDGSTRDYSITITGESLNSAFLPSVSLPKGSKFKGAILRVDAAFAVSSGGTVTFGGTVPGTNGIVLTEAELENIGTKVPASTGAGTWAVASATGTTAAELITKAISGTVTATQGKATLILTFVNKTKV